MEISPENNFLNSLCHVARVPRDRPRDQGGVSHGGPRPGSRQFRKLFSEFFDNVLREGF